MCNLLQNVTMIKTMIDKEVICQGFPIINLGNISQNYAIPSDDRVSTLMLFLSQFIDN